MSPSNLTERVHRLAQATAVTLVASTFLLVVEAHAGQLTTDEARRQDRIVLALGHLSKHLHDPSMSIVLVRVIKTDPPTRSSGSSSPDGAPKVKSARLEVIDKLSGPPVGSYINLLNPPESKESGFLDKPDHTLTRRMRVGEIWLLPYAPVPDRFDLYAFPGITLLSGIDDPAIAYLQRRMRWLSEPDPINALQEIRTVVLDSKQSLLARKLAFQAIWTLRDERHRRRDHRSPVYVAAQRLIVELLRQPEVHRDLHQLALNSIDIDASKPITRGSDEDFKLRFVLRLLLDEDRQLAANASSRLYDMSIKSGAENGKPVAYFFPDIIEALEHCASQDVVTGRTSFATGALRNLELAHRRRVEDVPKNMTVVIRRLP